MKQHTIENFRYTTLSGGAALQMGDTLVSSCFICCWSMTTPMSLMAHLQCLLLLCVFICGDFGRTVRRVASLPHLAPPPAG